MKRFLKTTLCIAILSAFFASNINAQITPTEEAVKNLKAYPTSVDEYVRHVIYVEQKENENAFQIELVPGKMVEVDCNRHGLLGNFVEETINGWGFTYYVFKSDGQMISTQMACPGPKEEKFVSGETLMTRYNSRLPLVVYLPKGMDLKYKIWTVSEELTAEKQ